MGRGGSECSPPGVAVLGCICMMPCVNVLGAGEARGACVCLRGRRETSPALLRSGVIR